MALSSLHASVLLLGRILEAFPLRSTRTAIGSCGRTPTAYIVHCARHLWSRFSRAVKSYPDMASSLFAFTFKSLHVSTNPKVNSSPKPDLPLDLRQIAYWRSRSTAAVAPAAGPCGCELAKIHSQWRMSIEPHLACRRLQSLARGSAHVMSASGPSPGISCPSLPQPQQMLMPRACSWNRPGPL